MLVSAVPSIAKVVVAVVVVVVVVAAAAVAAASSTTRDVPIPPERRPRRCLPLHRHRPRGPFQKTGTTTTTAAASSFFPPPPRPPSRGSSHPSPARVGGISPPPSRLVGPNGRPSFSSPSDVGEMMDLMRRRYPDEFEGNGDGGTNGGVVLWMDEDAKLPVPTSHDPSSRRPPRLVLLVHRREYEG